MDIRQVTCSQLKAEARESLRGKWGIMSLFVFLLNFIPSILLVLGEFLQAPALELKRQFPEIIYYSGLSTDPAISKLLRLEDIGVSVMIVGFVIFILVTGPLSYGVSRAELSISRKLGVKFGDLFIAFKNSKVFGKAILLQVFMSILIFLWFLLPLLILSVLIGLFTLGGSLSGSIVILIPIFIISLILPIIATLRYSMSYYVMVDNPELSVTACVRESKKMMNEKIKKYFVLQLSFIGEILINLVVLIGILYLIFNVTLESYINSPYKAIQFILGPGFITWTLLLVTFSIAGVSSLTAYIRNASAAFYRYIGEDSLIDENIKKEEWLAVGLTTDSTFVKPESDESSKAEENDKKDDPSDFSQNKEEEIISENKTEDIKWPTYGEDTTQETKDD